MSNDKIRCYVGTDWQDAEERLGYDGGFTSEYNDVELAVQEAVEHACTKNSPDYYRDVLYVIAITEEGAQRRFTVEGYQDWVWRMPEEVEV